MSQPRPVGPRVLVKLFDESDVAMWVPTNSQRPLRGTILAVGDDLRYDLEVADEILFTDDGVYEFRHEGETLFVVPEQRVVVLLDRASVRYS